MAIFNSYVSLPEGTQNHGTEEISPYLSSIVLRTWSGDFKTYGRTHPWGVILWFLALLLTWSTSPEEVLEDRTEHCSTLRQPNENHPLTNPRNIELWMHHELPLIHLAFLVLFYELAMWNQWNQPDQSQKLDSNLAEFTSSLTLLLVPEASGVTYRGCRRGSCSPGASGGVRTPFGWPFFRSSWGWNVMEQTIAVHSSW